MKNHPPLNLKWLFFSFKGRIARQSFILAQVFLLTILILIIRQIILIGDGANPQIGQWGLVLLVALIFSVYCSLATAIKRLHDLNLPWIALALLFLPMLNMALILYLMCKSSFPDANEHGEPPFAPLK